MYGKFIVLKIAHTFTRTVCHSLKRLLVFLLVFFTLLPTFLLLRGVDTVQADSSFMTTSGTNLMLNGSQIKFIGVNRYDLLATVTWSDAALAQMFSDMQAMNVTAIRFWAYQDWTSGDTDFSRLDYVVNTLSPTYGVKLIPTFDDQFNFCGGFKYDSWYQSGYLSPAGTCSIAYKDHVTTIVNRYKNSSSIAMWDLMNEPEDKNSDGSCASGDNLYTFLSDMAAYVKSLDSNHLVTVGLIGGLQCGVNGNYQHLNSLANIDVLQAHDYGFDTVALPGSTDSPFYGKAFVQDNTWNWTDSGYKNNSIGTWTTHTFTIPQNAATPINHIGFAASMTNPGWNGTVYIDDVTVGSTTYSFEDGTIQGWDFWPTDGMVGSLSNSTNYAYDGTHSLAVHLNGTTTDTTIFVIPPPSVNPGDTVTLHIFIPGNAPFSVINSIASDMQVAKNLNKPFVMGEAGIKSNTFCSDPNCYPLATRASYFSDKISAFFNNGGAGYLIWSYPIIPDSTTDVFGFTTSDPLYTVVQTDAAIINAGGELEVSEHLFFLLPILLALPVVLYLLTDRQRRKRALFLLLHGSPQQLLHTLFAPCARLFHSLLNCPLR